MFKNFIVAVSIMSAFTCSAQIEGIWYQKEGEGELVFINIFDVEFDDVGKAYYFDETGYILTDTMDVELKWNLLITQLGSTREEFYIEFQSTDEFLLSEDDHFDYGMDTRYYKSEFSDLSVFLANKPWEDNVTSLEEFIRSWSGVYPNPAINQINFDYDGIITSVEVFNTFGQIVLISKGEGVGVKGLMSGTYFVKIHSDKGVLQDTFVIK